MPRQRLITNSYGDGQAARTALDAIPMAEPTNQVENPEPLDPMAEAIRRAQEQAPPAGYLTQPSQRPGEPVQAGLNLGPGPGQSALFDIGIHRVANDFETIAAATGSPAMAQIARRARMRVTRSERIAKRRLGPGRQQKHRVGLLPAQRVATKTEDSQRAFNSSQLASGTQTQPKAGPVERGIGPPIQKGAR